MSDFFSGFWNYYIITGAVGGIIFCTWLLTAMSKRRATNSKKPELHSHVWDEDLREYNNPLPRWWMGLFYITILFGIGYLALYPGLGTFGGVLGWSSNGEYNKEQEKAQADYAPLFEKYVKLVLLVTAVDPVARAAGQRLFLVNCAQCHGSDGGGSKGFPSLADKDWLYGGEPQTILASITDGRNGAMPSFAKTLSSEQINDVAYYVLSLSGYPSNSLQIYSGRKVFSDNCIACHGVDAKGNHAIGAPNLTDKIWLHGGTSNDVIETIAKGRNSHMPAHKDILDPAKIHLLAAYIYSLSIDPDKLTESAVNAK